MSGDRHNYPEYRAASARGSQCKVCNHPGRQEIDLMLLNGEASYPTIIKRMKSAHPEAPALLKSNLSRHREAHLVNQPVKTTMVDPETGEEVTGFIVGHLASAPLVPKDAIPAKEQRISHEDALAVIINIGLRNALSRPETVSMRDVVNALDLARKMGIKGADEEEFDDAWKTLGKQKEEMKRTRRRRKVTVEEEEVTSERPAPRLNECPCGYVYGEDARFCAKCGRAFVIDAEVVAPEDWSDSDLKLLEGGDADEPTS